MKNKTITVSTRQLKKLIDKRVKQELEKRPQIVVRQPFYSQTYRTCLLRFLWYWPDDESIKAKIASLDEAALNN